MIRLEPTMFKRGKCKVSSKQKVYKDHRGEKEDRRSFAPSRVFPLIDQFGRLIGKDRRSMPDRRIANIQVKEQQISSNKKLFTKKKEV